MTIKKGDILLGKYRIDKCRLGPGAYSNVYLATHLDLKVQRALKILRKGYEGGLGSQDFADYAERFRLEAQLGARLDHPNIVRVHDFSASTEQLVLVMEYCAGGSLAEVIEKVRDEECPLPIEYVLQIAEQVAAGLAELHKKQIVHRDLKPANILLDKNGVAKVADLGLAQVPGGPSKRGHLSSPISHPGTPGYMSPEQKSSGDILTSASDIYSLGLVLFELLTGNIYELLRPGTQLVGEREDAPEWLNELLIRMLAKKVEDRPWGGNETLQALMEGEEQEKSRKDTFRIAVEEKALEEAWQEAVREEAEKQANEEVRKKATTEKEEKLKQAEEAQRKANEQNERLRKENQNLKTELEGKQKNEEKYLRVNENYLVDKKKVQKDIVNILFQRRLFLAKTEVNIAKNSKTPLAFSDMEKRNFESENPKLRNGLEMEFIKIPAGAFLYGEEKVRKIIQKNYWIGKYPVTNEQYQQFINANPNYRIPDHWDKNSRTYPQGKDRHPVVYVSWKDAQAFCKWAEFRLPLEEEWEKASRGTDGRIYPWGVERELGKYCNSREAKKGETTPVDKYPLGISPYGVWDMSGNIWEWTASKYNNKTYVLRGGAWGNSVHHVRSTQRNRYTPDSVGFNLGFRCLTYYSETP